MVHKYVSAVCRCRAAVVVLCAGLLSLSGAVAIAATPAPGTEDGYSLRARIDREHRQFLLAALTRGESEGYGVRTAVEYRLDWPATKIVVAVPNRGSGSGSNSRPATSSASSSPAPPASTVPPAPADPNAVPWTLSIPSLGVSGRVEGADDSNAIVDRGLIWHWTGTGTMAHSSHVVVFAHRTSKGGLFRNIHRLNNGDAIVVTTLDGRSFTYAVADSAVVGPDAQSIFGAASSIPGRTLSLVACSQPDGTPTSLDYRIVVTATFVG